MIIYKERQFQIEAAFLLDLVFSVILNRPNLLYENCNHNPLPRIGDFL